MIHKMQKEDCCGCQACVSICPQNCISLKTDEEGFWYPMVDEAECISCGKCEIVCPFMSSEECGKEKEIDVYGAWCTEEEVRFSSSSGGLFTVLADDIIEQGGVVFGVKVGADGDIIHSCTDSKEGISQFRKSKYVQSNMKNTYQDVKGYLDIGKKVLFSGTPCQILALHRFLGKNYEGLYIVDVICVGVSSPGVWKKYLKQLENENQGKITKIIFRHKETDGVVLKNGQRNLTLHVAFDNSKTLYQYCDENMFFNGFLNKLYLRPSCAACKAKDFRSGSDIQLGDFWEIEKMYPEVLDVSEDGERIPFGISEVLIYTKKGQEWFQRIKDRINCFKADRMLVESEQTDTNWYLLKSGSQQHWNRDTFFKEYKENSDNVYELIKKNLNIRNLENLSGKNIGMWGSYNLRNSIGIISDYTDCELKFQFRNSTICSLMSEPNTQLQYMKGSSNPFRNRMLRNDIEKEFRTNIEKYASEADFFIMDLLEERYDSFIVGQTIITKSEGYFETTGIQGMPVFITFDMWKKTFCEFMEFVQRYFSISNMMIAENYLCSRYGRINAPKYEYKEKNKINRINSMLEERYNYIRTQWPEIKMLPPIPDSLLYTEASHRYGCVPEHMNRSACIYLAQEIGEAVGQ
jgi:Coenzyme F420-reducing hydrogenase, beta subunit